MFLELNFESFFSLFNSKYSEFQPAATLNAGITGMRAAAYGAATAAAASVSNPSLANYAMAAG